MEWRDRIRRLVDFFQDFLLQKPIQLLFPFASLLLLLGAGCPWLPPRHTLVDFQVQARETDLWFNISSRASMLGYSVSLLCVKASALASIALWLLPVESPLRTFRRWVLAPAGVGVLVFSAMVFLSWDPRVSILEHRSQGILDLFSRFPARLATLGLGYYLTLIGGLAICGALWGFYSGHIPLPVRFRNSATSKAGNANSVLLLRNVVTLVIVTGLLVSICWDVVALTRGNNFWGWSWGTGKFPAFDWVLGTSYAALTACCAIAIFGRSGRLSWKRFFLLPKVRDAGLVLSLMLAALYVPRILQGLIQQTDWASIGVSFGFPFTWAELLLPRPFLWLLLVFITALLQEISLRGILQLQLTEAVGLKRAIFLVGLLWVMLPLSYGTHPILAADVHLLGAGIVIDFVILISYSVILGWVFARGQSIFSAAMAHGTILLFHEGSGGRIYINDPFVYWAELGALTIAGWYIFKRYPLESRDVSPEIIQP